MTRETVADQLAAGKEPRVFFDGIGWRYWIGLHQSPKSYRTKREATSAARRAVRCATPHEHDYPWR